MGQLADLLAAVRDNPDDAFLRGVAADALEERHGHRLIDPFVPMRLALPAPPEPAFATIELKADSWLLWGPAEVSFAGQPLGIINAAPPRQTCRNALEAMRRGSARRTQRGR